MNLKLVICALFVALSSLFTGLAQAQDAKVCWKPSYGRGVGLLPSVCPGGQANDAGLCYNACPPGRVGVGPACHTPCPAGWAPVGADPTAVSCWKPAMANDRQFSYGRGAGYVAWDGEKCARENAQGCEYSNLIHYPRCQPGYVGVGPVCWQQLQACPAGFRDDGLACAKPGLQGRGAGGIPTGCEGGRQYQAGLCYQGCNSGFNGIGPVCWGQCPRAMPVDCGAMCGQSADDCAKSITQQVTGVLEVIVNVASTVATAGAGSGAVVGANAAKQAAAASGKAAIGNAAKQMAKNVSKESIKNTIRKVALDAGKNIAENQLENLTNAAAGEDFDFTSLDPTGIAAMIKNFVLPMCASDTPLPASFGAMAIKEPNNQTVYLLDPEGKRWPMSNAQVFFGCGFTDWSQVRQVSSEVLNTIPMGSALESPQACIARRDRVREVMQPVALPPPPAAQPTPGLPGGPSGAASGGLSAGYPQLQARQGAGAPGAPQNLVDPAFYMGAYPDLMAAFRGNADQARNHWLQFGIREGRQPSANFYAASYLARYDDLKIAFGNNYEAALRHWIDNGWREGRDASPNGRLPMGAIVRLPDSGATYVVDASGAKRWITSGPVFDGCGLSWNMAQDLRRAVIDALPSGPNLNTVAECQAALRAPLRPGALLRNSTNGALHVVDAAGAKRPIANPTALAGCGAAAVAQTTNVFKLVLDRIPDGPAIQTAAQCQALVAAGLSNR